MFNILHQPLRAYVCVYFRQLTLRLCEFTGVFRVRHSGTDLPVSFGCETALAMSSSSPNPAEALDGPNKKCRVQELIHLPDSLDDAMLQLATTTTQQQLPADEASRALVTLQLGSADESSPRRRVGGLGPVASTAVVCASNAIQTVAAAAQQTEINPIPTRGTGEAVTKAAAKRAESTARVASYNRETSQEPAPSDPGTCVSLDIAAGSSA